MKIELEVYEASVEGDQNAVRVRLLRQQLQDSEPTVSFRDHDSGDDLLPTDNSGILVNASGRVYRLGKRIG